MHLETLLGLDKQVTVVEQAGFKDLQENLDCSRNADSCHLAMHGDALWSLASDGSEVFTPGLVKKDGSLDLVEPQRIAQLFAPYAVKNGGRLELIFINGCRSASYGYSLYKEGFVVVCWSTLVHDTAAKLFATALYQARANGNSYQQAFNIAEDKIKVDFDLRVPKTPPPAPTTKPAAGIPKIFLPGRFLFL